MTYELDFSNLIDHLESLHRMVGDAINPVDIYTEAMRSPVSFFVSMGNDAYWRYDINKENSDRNMYQITVTKFKFAPISSVTGSCLYLENKKKQRMLLTLLK